jgi:hypothetical protein
MGRKSSSKEQRASAGKPSDSAPKKGLGPMLLGILVIALLGVGAVAMWSGNASGSAATPEPAQNAAVNPPLQSEVAKNEAAAKALAAIGPHKQATLPPLPVRGYAPPRPMQTVQAAFQFAAEHPEVASYVPCFCGCQSLGHRGNEDCFVKMRAQNGDVIQWEEHGIECAVCIDVATRSRQMHASGASVADIRAAVEKEFAHNFPSMTPTPKPPARGN